MKRMTPILVFLTCGCVVASLAVGFVTSRRPWQTVVVRTAALPPEREPDIRLGGTQFRHANSRHWFEGNTLAFSPDARTLYSGGEDGIVKAWSPETGELHGRFIGRSTVNALAVSKDGARLATGDISGFVRIWDVRSGELLWTARAHRDRAGSVSFSPDRTRLLSGGDDGHLVVFDAETGNEIQRILRDDPDEPGGPVHAEYSPDGETFLTVGYRDPCRIWNAAEGRELRRLPTISGGLGCFSPLGTVLGPGRVAPAELFDPASGVVIAELNPDRYLRRSAFSPDGTRVVFAGLYGHAEVWEIPTRRRLFALERHFDKIQGLAYSPDGKWIATSERDGLVRVFEAASGKPGVRPSGHQAIVTALAVEPGGKSLFSGSPDGTIIQWELPAGRPRRSLTWPQDRAQPSNRCYLHTLAFSPGGSKLASGDTFLSTRVWDATSGRELLAIEDGTQAMAWAANGTQLLLRKGNGETAAWDAATGKKIRSLERCGRRFVPAPYRDAFATLSNPWNGRGEIELRSNTDGAVIRTFPVAVDFDWASFAFASDGKRLVAAQKPGLPFVIFDVETTSPVLEFGAADSYGTYLAFTPDGTRIATAEQDVISVWDASSGSRLDWFRTGQSRVSQLAFDSESKLLFSAGSDGTICGWNVATRR